MLKLLRYTCFVFLFLLPFAVMQAQTRSANIQTIEGKKYYIHKIEKSQSLYAISKLYNVTVDDLYRINPELKSGAKVNQEIRVPFANPQATPAATVNLGSQPAIDTLKYNTHKVAKGETVYSITRKYNLSEKELLTFNPTLNTGMREGQMIIVGEKNKKRTAQKQEVKQIFTAPQKPVSVIVDSNLFRPVSKPKKNAYNISLILPFKLEQTLALDNNELVRNNSNFPEIPSIALDFYLGFKMAADSLRDDGFTANLQIFDSDDRDSIILNRILNDKTFLQSDLIFGPLYANGFKNISKKAKELYVPIVSPITQQNKILYNNIYISKTNPSQFTLMESLADFCIDSLASKGANVIIMTLNDKDKKETGFVSAFKKYYNEKQKSLGRTPKDTVCSARGINGLKLAYKSNMKNVVISLSSNPVFITDFTTQLSIFAERKDIVLCGWQSTTEMDNIDQAYLNNLHYTFPHQYNLTNLASFKKPEEEYIKLQETTPGEYFYVGFDVGIYYLKHLKEKGPDFVHQLDQNSFETSYLRFKFARPDNTTGFDNRGVYIFRYEDLHLQNTGWK